MQGYTSLLAVHFQLFAVQHAAVLDEENLSIILRAALHQEINLLWVWLLCLDEPPARTCARVAETPNELANALSNSCRTS